MATDAEETYNPWTIVNVVFTHLAEQGLHPTFGGDGRAITADLIYTGWDVAIASDGAAIMSGTLYATPANRIAAVRFTPDGTFDTTFGVDGFAVAPMPGGGQGEGAVAIQPDGKIVATGYRYTPNAFIAARWSGDGTPDGGFGDSGVASAAFPSGRSNSTALALADDGGILTGGYAGYNDNDDWALAKFIGS